MAFYLDTSALAKLVVDEAETAALRAWLDEGLHEVVSSDLVRTELFRAVRRVAPDRMELARRVLDAVSLLEVTSATFDAAARLEPAELRSLDAVHLAAALELGEQLEGLVTYDQRLGAAAAANAVLVVAPT